MNLRMRLLLVALVAAVVVACVTAIVGVASYGDGVGEPEKRHLLIIAMGIAIGGAAAALLVIEFGVMRPLVTLGRELEEIATSADPARRVRENGASEVVATARAANASLAMLELALARLAEEGAERDALLLAIPDDVLLVENDGGCTPVVGGQGADNGKIHLGVRLAELAPDGTHPLLDEMLGAARAGRRAALRYQARHTTGLRHHEMRLLPVADGRVLAMVRDITTEVEDEQRLQRAIAAAEAANRAKGAFLANLSHELRSPLNGILGMAQLLGGEDLPDLQRERLAVIADSSDDLLALINQLLDLSRLGSERMELVDQPFRLIDVAHHVVDALAARAWIKGVDVVLVCAADLPVQASGDGGRLRQVLTNLVANAIKFTERGEVVVRLRCEPAEGGRLVLHGEVADTGPGITPEVAARLFQPFEQGGAAVADRHGGTGLGLAIAKGLVELMHGRIGLESVPGQGTTFRFTATLGAIPDPLQVPIDLGAAAVLCAGDSQFAAIGAALAGIGLRALRAQAGNPVLTIADADLLTAPVHEPAVLLVGPRWRGRAGARLAVVRKPCHPLRLREAALNALSGHGDDPQTAPRPHPAAAGARRARVLVVDDQPVNRAIAIGLLRTLGIEAEAESEPRRAVDRILGQLWDLVLMDCRMPGIDGLEATRRIRAAEDGRRTTVVALTANAMSDDRERCLAAGMDDHLAKPLHLADLEAALLRWLGHAAMPPAAPGTVGSAVRLHGLAEGFSDLVAQAGAEAVADAARGLLASVPAQLRDCAAAIAAGDAEALLDAAHALKGDAASCNLDALAIPAGELAAAARGGRCDPGLDAVLERARSAWMVAEPVVKGAAGG